MAKHVRWCFNATKWIPTKEQWVKLSSALPIDELDRINRFVYKEDAKTSLIGQVLIRAFLSKSLGMASNEIPLSRNDHGRPQLTREYSDKIDCNIDFNVSHSGDYCVLAGCHNNLRYEVKVGVDVTKIVKKNSKQELDRFLYLMSKREFLDTEWRKVTLAANDREKCVQFTRLWCLKESLIKAVGTGLAYDLRRIEFKLRDDEILSDNLSKTTTVKVDGIEDLNWRFLETRIDEDHLVAIGYHCRDDAYELDLETNFVPICLGDLMNSLTPIHKGDDANWDKFIKKHTKGAIN